MLSSASLILGLSRFMGVGTGNGPSMSSTPSRNLSKDMSRLKGSELSGASSESVICCP